MSEWVALLCPAPPSAWYVGPCAHGTAWTCYTVRVYVLLYNQAVSGT